MPTQRPPTRGLSVTTAPVLTMPETEDIFNRAIREMHDLIARRAFDIHQSRSWQLGRDHDDWLEAESQLLRMVPVEIADNDDELRVYADVPGFDTKDLDIHLEPTRILTT